MQHVEPRGQPGPRFVKEKSEPGVAPGPNRALKDQPTLSASIAALRSEKTEQCQGAHTMGSSGGSLSPFNIHLGKWYCGARILPA